MERKNFRDIFYFKNYYLEFFSGLSVKEQKKIIFVLRLIECTERVPSKFLKHLEGTDGLYEIRVKQGNNIFRIFCFFDEGKLIVLVNGFQKKTQKTPKKEIEKALRIKKQYENEK